MLIKEEQLKGNSQHEERVVASLNAHTELIKRLVYDIETDSLSSQALKHRINEIEKRLKTLREAV